MTYQPQHIQYLHVPVAKGVTQDAARSMEDQMIAAMKGQEAANHGALKTKEQKAKDLAERRERVWAAVKSQGKATTQEIMRITELTDGKVYNDLKVLCAAERLRKVPQKSRNGRKFAYEVREVTK